jgi:hypothetical protein
MILESSWQPVVLGAIILLLILLGVIVIVKYFKTVPPKQTAVSTTNYSQMQCDCMDSLKHMFINKIYLERMLISSPKELTMTMTRLKALNGSISEAIEFAIMPRTDMMTTLHDLFNEWDTLLLTMLTTSNQLETSMINKEEEVLLLINRPELGIFLQQYRKATFSEIKNHREGHYAASFVNLDQAIDAMMAFVNGLR